MLRETLLYPENLIAAGRRYGRVLWISGPAVLHRLHGGLCRENLRAHTAGIFSAGGALAAQSAQLLRDNGLFCAKFTAAAKPA